MYVCMYVCMFVFLVLAVLSSSPIDWGQVRPDMYAKEEWPGKGSIPILQVNFKVTFELEFSPNLSKILGRVVSYSLNVQSSFCLIKLSVLFCYTRSLAFRCPDRHMARG
ncbi:hypothetical protein BDF14DRAFT_841759 [Spinellus fusiger]|nr:hypothetical protein BDF14DRAFT_841759 [Spinellus fusiger]